MKRKGFVPFAVVALLVLLAATTFGAKILQYKFSSAGEVPGAAETTPLSDSLTQIVGYYFIEIGNFAYQNGYLQTTGARTHTPFLSLEPPGGWFAFAAGVNNHGMVVGGSCVPPQQCIYPETMHGFSYSGGTYTTIDYPGADSTGAYGINDLGQIVGGFCLTISVCARTQIPTDHAFLESNGTFTELDYPGAQSTHASAINNAGVVAGYYELPTAQVLGFIYNKGQFYTVMHPGPSTGLSGINDPDIIVGTYSPPMGLQLTFKGVPVK